MVWARESVGNMLRKALLAILCLLMISAPVPTIVGAEEDALHTPAGGEKALQAEQGKSDMENRIVQLEGEKKGKVPPTETHARDPTLLDAESGVRAALVR